MSKAKASIQAKPLYLIPIYPNLSKTWIWDSVMLGAIRDFGMSLPVLRVAAGLFGKSKVVDPSRGRASGSGPSGRTPGHVCLLAGAHEEGVFSRLHRGV